MKKLTRDDLYSLEEYAERRADFRDQVMAHKRPRRISVGDHATFYFEDRLTMLYQVQEMLRAERIFERDGIEEELSAYNPLIPDGHNWKVTFMLEYSDENERHAALQGLKGIENRAWVQVDGHAQVYAIADEDLDRETQEKTSAVHFLRFELDAEMVRAARAGAAIGAGLDHPRYQATVSSIPEASRASLVADLDG